MRRRGWTLATLVAVTVAGLATSEARAGRRGFVLIHHGEDVVHVGDVADESREVVHEMTEADPAVGFIHSGFGVMLLDVWTWDGRYCLYSGDHYWELEPEQAATLLDVPADELSVPLLYTFPPGAFLLGLLGVAFGGHTIRHAGKMKRLGALFSDPRYEKALAILQERIQAASADSDATVDRDQALQAAVTHLRGEGIPEEEARHNLDAMLEALAAAAREREEEDA